MVEKTLKVLLVDDDEDDSIIIRELFDEIKITQFTVDWVTNKKQAIEALENNSHDVCLLDYWLGSTTGLALLEEISNKNCKVPIVLLTGQAGHDIDIEAMKAGAADFLDKNELTSALLERSIRYSIENNRVNDELAEAVKQLRHQAHYDELTGLPNRILFREHIERALARARRSNEILGILFLDLDRFKIINDTLGHDAGDALLKEASNRISNCLREVDTAARWGGDEFIIILENISEIGALITVAEKLLAALAQPICLAREEVYVSASIGIANYPDSGGDADTLMKNADTAMYQAKNQGRDNYHYYTAEMNAQTHERLLLDSQLCKGLEHNEFVVYYQPVLEIDSMQIIGAEALLRWQHPQRGLVSPCDFIPALEENGLITTIGEWVLRSVCKQSLDWQNMGLPPLRMMVNLSSRQFGNHNLTEIFTNILKETNIEPDSINIEITENILMEDAQQSCQTLGELKKLGIHISLANFSADYSSLSYLKHFPIDTLKIDQSLIQDLTQNSNSVAIVTAILALKKDLQLEVIAEGVQTATQLSILRSLDCRTAQGYLFGFPMSPDTFANQFQPFTFNSNNVEKLPSFNTFATM